MAGKVFFANFIQKEHAGRAYEVMNAGFIPLANAAIALKVVASFAAVFVVLAACRLVNGKYTCESEGEE